VAKKLCSLHFRIKFYTYLAYSKFTESDDDNLFGNLEYRYIYWELWITN